MNPTEEIYSSWTVVGKKRSPNKAAQSTSGNPKMNIDVKKKPPAKGATESSIIKKETMTIEPDMIGVLVGRQGCNLERLKDTYGVKFILPPRKDFQIILE